jgi:hypothetical protein
MNTIKFKKIDIGKKIYFAKEEFGKDLLEKQERKNSESTLPESAIS